MRRVTGLEPKMWGPTLVGFGEREYDLAGGKKLQASGVRFGLRRLNFDDVRRRIGLHRFIGFGADGNFDAGVILDDSRDRDPRREAG